MIEYDVSHAGVGSLTGNGEMVSEKPVRLPYCVLLMPVVDLTPKQSHSGIPGPAEGMFLCFPFWTGILLFCGKTTFETRFP